MAGINYVLHCEHVSTDEGGKPTFFGVTNAIHAPILPYRIPSMVVTTQIVGAPQEALVLSLMIFPVAAAQREREKRKAVAFHQANVILGPFGVARRDMTFLGLTFEELGLYVVAAELGEPPIHETSRVSTFFVHD